MEASFSDKRMPLLNALLITVSILIVDQSIEPKQGLLEPADLKLMILFLFY